VLNWQVQAAGETVPAAATLNLTPQGHGDFTLCDNLTLPPGAREVWLTLEVVQPQATPWSTPGTASPGAVRPRRPAGLRRPPPSAGAGADQR
jgi:predicted benzoate:H+ symporter BenE